MNTDDLPFREDFTQRVLDTAAATMRRRRYVRGASVACAVVLLAGVGTFGALQSVRPNTAVADQGPHLVTSFDTIASNDTQTETDYLFPETSDLNTFSSNYTGTTDDGQMLFADDADEAGGEK